MSIKRKIAVLTTVWFTILLILLDITVYILFIQTATDNERDSLQTRTEAFIGKRSLSGLLNESPFYYEVHLPQNNMFRLLDEQGQPLKQIGKDTELYGIPPKSVSSAESEIIRRNGQQFLFLRVPVEAPGQPSGTVEIIEQLDALEESKAVLVYILTSVTLGAILLSIISSRYLSKMLIKPISSMSQTMEEVERSLEFARLPESPGSKDELSAMSATFNRMMQRLELSFQRQRQFVSDASHELKTPITIIEGYARMLMRWGINDQNTREEAVEAIFSEAVRMNELAHQLLDLVSLDVGQQLNLGQVDLTQLLYETVNSISKIYHREIRVAGSRNLTLVADSIKLKQVLNILLDNALKYSSGPIGLAAEHEAEGGVHIRVSDNGIGIPQHELEQVFERFYRVDEARSRKTGGSGLGLSIARRIIRLHHGTIHIQSGEHGGTTVIVYLPPTSTDQ